MHDKLQITQPLEFAYNKQLKMDQITISPEEVSNLRSNISHVRVFK